MPSICSVPRCNGNYRNGPKVSVFGFPFSNPELLEKWIRGIKRDFKPTSYSKVCELHFASEDLIREDSVYDEKTGRTLTVPLERPRLKKDAIPCKMPDCPAYMSKETVIREAPGERKKRKHNELLSAAIEESKAAKQKYDAERSFSNLQELKTKLHLISVPEDWSVVLKQNCILICNIILNPNPHIDNCLTINENLQLNFSKRAAAVKKWKNFNFPISVNNVNSIADILNGVVNCDKQSCENEFENSVQLVQSLLTTMINENQATAIPFLKEQVGLLCMKKPSYSSETIIFAALFYTMSPRAYKFVRSCGNVYLPHPSTLERVCSAFSMSPTEEENNDKFLNYIKYKFSFLEDLDKKVVLMLDEIHVKSFIDYKGGNITGMAFDRTKMATSAHVFMISSMTSSYKDVVHILPVQSITNIQLHLFIRKIIIGLENIGFLVIAVVTDNNSINRRAMSRFITPPSHEILYPHPADKARPLFHVYDSVHLLKSIRNNWLNQKNSDMNMYFPTFKGFTEDIKVDLHTASFGALRALHNYEDNSLARFGYNLTLKALAPSVLERQNVNLALKIFNNFVVEALYQLGARYNISNFAGTAAYLKIINTWWSILNVKSPFKGVRLNDTYKYPLTASENDERKQFLCQFLDWLDAWKNLNCESGMLTKQTFTALRQTTYAIIEIASYCHEELDFTYILPGKFQTDNLESRFGLYRQLSGGQYHVSMRQIFESEKKLRMQSCLLLSINTKSQGKMQILNFTPQVNFDDMDEKVERQINLSLTGKDFVKVEDKLPVLVYIAGYSAYSVVKKLKCSDCKISLTMEKDIDLGEAYKFVESLDRGKLKYPSSYVINCVIYVFVIVSKLCFEYEEMFLKDRNQRKLATSIARNIIINEEVFPEVDCNVGHNSEKNC